jgi:ankyrin repeat protein
MQRLKILIACLSIITLLATNVKAEVAAGISESTAHMGVGMSPINPTKLGWTELMEAIKNGDLAAVNTQLNKGVDINAKYNNDSTALMIAAYNGNLEIVKALVNQGADINIQDSNGGTALSRALLWNNIAIAQFLLEKGIKDDDALFIATRRGYASILDAILKNVNDINSFRTQDGMTLLMIATKEGFRDIFEILLNKGADVNLKDAGGLTPLMIAVTRGNSEFINTLINKGANVNIQDEHGVTALMNAVENGDISTVQLLLAHGANVNVRDEKGRSPISLAYTLKSKQKRSIKNLLVAASKPLSIKPDATFQFETISKAVNDVALNKTFSDFKNKNQEMELYKFHENYDDHADSDDTFSPNRNWFFEEIPDEVAEDVSGLWYQLGFQDWCYEAVLENNGIETVSLFYTGLAFEKVDPKVQWVVVINKKADIKLDGVVSHLIKLGLKQKPLPQKDDSNKSYIKNLAGLFDNNQIVAYIFSNENYITLVIDNKTFIENGRLQGEHEKSVKDLGKDKRLEDDLKEALTESSALEIPTLLKDLPKVTEPDSSSEIDLLTKVNSALEKILKDDKIPREAVPPTLFIMSTYCPSKIEFQNKPSEKSLEPLNKAKSLGVKYKTCGGSRSYCYTYSLLNEIIEKHPGTKWGERAMVQLVWNAFGECDDYDHYCETFVKVINTLSEFLPKCKDQTAICDLTFQLGAAYEAYWSLSKEGMLDSNSMADESKKLPSIEVARTRAIDCYKKVISLDKNGIYKSYIGNSIPMLYLDIPPSHEALFFLLWE